MRVTTTSFIRSTIPIIHTRWHHTSIQRKRKPTAQLPQQPDSPKSLLKSQSLGCRSLLQRQLAKQRAHPTGELLEELPRLLHDLRHPRGGPVDGGPRLSGHLIVAATRCTCKGVCLKPTFKLHASNKLKQETERALSMGPTKTKTKNEFTVQQHARLCPPSPASYM